MIHNTSYEDCPSRKQVKLGGNHSTSIIHHINAEQVQEDHSASLSWNSLLYNLALSGI